MRYVDGFVIPVPKKNLKAYRSMARLGKRIWLKHGALDYQECVSDDVRPAFGLPFPKGIRARVVASEFLGHIERVTLDVPGANAPVSLHRTGCVRLIPGDIVFLDVDALGVVVVPDDAG